MLGVLVDAGRAADPLDHALVLLVVRIGEHLEELGVTPGATAVLGRAGSAAGGGGLGVRLTRSPYRPFGAGAI